MATSLTLAIFTMTIAHRAQGSPPQPANGDIILLPYSGDSNLPGFYEVQVYLSNGVDQPGYGQICADDSYREEATVICNQMGYKYSDFAYRNIDGSVWLKDITCDESDLHILRCQYGVAVGSERTDTELCGPHPNKLLIKCDFSTPLPHYNGKLALCQADNATEYPIANVIQSASFGIVSLYLESHDTWRGLETKTQLGATEANTICRQMGFTGAVPGSAVALSASDHTFKKCFDQEKPFRLHNGAWMTTDSVACGAPQRCFGCCYSYPPLDACTDCAYLNTLIISCTFDPTAAVLTTGSAGSEGNCQLNSANTLTHCESGCSTKSSYSLRVGLGISITLLVILGPFGIVCIGYLCYKMYKAYHRRRYRRVDNQQNNQQINIDDN